MQITDPIADMLTRIRNAGAARHATVEVPASSMKKAIAQILLDEGYIKGFEVVNEGVQGVIKITLKYNAGKEKAISGLRRVSKPGLRVYAGADELPRVLKGLGVAIVSTSKGVMTDKRLASSMWAARSWLSFGKGGKKRCLVSAECPLPSPPVSKSRSTAPR